MKKVDDRFIDFTYTNSNSVSSDDIMYDGSTTVKAKFNATDAAIQGIDWQESVLDRYDPTSNTPVGPSTDDRYIATATANGWTNNNIYQYNGTSWDETVPTEGTATWVEDENTQYVYNGSVWVKLGSTVNHSSLNEIGNNAHSVIDTHLGSSANPHTVTAGQVGNDTVQWNASKLYGKEIDSNLPTVTGEALVYNSVSGKYEVGTPGISEDIAKKWAIVFG